MKKPPLTPKEKQLLTLIAENKRTAIPTVRELMVLMGLRSPGAVQYHLNSLRAKGYLPERRA